MLLLNEQSSGVYETKRTKVQSIQEKNTFAFSFISGKAKPTKKLLEVTESAQRTTGWTRIICFYDKFRRLNKAKCGRWPRHWHPKPTGTSRLMEHHGHAHTPWLTDRAFGQCYTCLKDFYSALPLPQGIAVCVQHRTQLWEEDKAEPHSTATSRLELTNLLGIFSLS